MATYTLRRSNLVNKIINKVMEDARLVWKKLFEFLNNCDNFEF